MEYLKVEGYSNLIRDKNTNSIINTNMAEYQEYISRRSAKNEESDKIKNLEENLVNMKDDIDEIKTLLRSLLNADKS